MDSLTRRAMMKWGIAGLPLAAAPGWAAAIGQDHANALAKLGSHGMTVDTVRGFGRQQGQTELFRGSSYALNLVPKTRIWVVADDEEAEEVIDPKPAEFREMVAKGAGLRRAAARAGDRVPALGQRLAGAAGLGVGIDDDKATERREVDHPPVGRGQRHLGQPQARQMRRRPVIDRGGQRRPVDTRETCGIHHRARHQSPA